MTDTTKEKRRKRFLSTARVVKRRWDRVMGIMMIWGPETKEEARSRQILTPGHYKDFNGTCNHWACRNARYDRAKEKRDWKKTLRSEGLFSPSPVFRSP